MRAKKFDESSTTIAVFSRSDYTYVYPQPYHNHDQRIETHDDHVSMTLVKNMANEER